MFPARREQEQGWQERDGGRARSCGTERRHKALSEQQGLVLQRLQMEMERAGEERTRHSWSATALISKAEGCWPEQEGRRRRVTHKNIDVTMKMQLPEDRKEEGTSLRTRRGLEENVPLV